MDWKYSLWLTRDCFILVNWRYCDTQPDGFFSTDNKPNSVVYRMIESMEGSSCNITMDNWFLSVDVVNDLVWTKNFKVVAICKKKKKIPPQLVNIRALLAHSSMSAFGENSMLVSYILKKYRNVPSFQAYIIQTKSMRSTY